MAHERPVVHTTTGAVRGVAPGDGRPLRFLGIPYAQPPVGPRRFRPTQPVEPWAGVLDASRFGPAAAQVYDPHEATLADFGVGHDDGTPVPSAVGDEDCLTLNVWTPAVGGDGALCPVLVWVHGGANWLESARLSCYDGEPLAQRGGIVVASLNYRLGVFGFLDLSVIGGPTGSHSHGLRDQLCALRWLHDNVARFGGDPANITLAGESAGAMNISWLVTTGRLRALVRRVVLMSGVASVVGLGHDHRASAHAEPEGRRRAAGFLSALGLHDMPTLQAMPAAELLARQAQLARRSDVLFEMDTLFYPRADGRFTHADPFTAAAHGLFDGLDVMIGFTAYEMGLWLQWDPALDQGTTRSMAARLLNFPDACRVPLADFYDRCLAPLRPGERAMHLLADACFAMPALLLADALRPRGGRLHVYRFDWMPGDARRGALHAADQGFFFGTHRSAAAELVIGAPRDDADVAQREALAATLQDALIGFVRQGDPGWPEYGERRTTMHFDAPHTHLRDDPLGDRRRWWHENVFAPALTPSST